jgi:hypothetical protein
MNPSVCGWVTTCNPTLHISTLIFWPMYTRAIDPGIVSGIADASERRIVSVRTVKDDPSPEMRAYIRDNRPVLYVHGRGTIISRGNALILRAIAFGRDIQRKFSPRSEFTIDHVVAEKPLLTHNCPVNAAADVVTRGNDLILTAIRLGRLVETSRPTRLTLVTPGKWKGQVPKDIHNARVLDKLTPGEITLIPDNHNAIDALGLLLWVLER